MDRKGNASASNQWDNGVKLTSELQPQDSESLPLVAVLTVNNKECGLHPLALYSCTLLCQ